MTHWCHDIPRDEAVRAAEDGRTGPLPTLEEAISRAGQFTPQEPPQEPKCTERDNFAEAEKRSAAVSKTGGGQSGLRTERVTLEITHSVPVGLWDWTHILETYRPGESVRVVEEVHFDDLANMSLERDAATQRAARDAVKCSALADKVIALRARVASLESQLESVACRAATAENRVADLEAAAKAAPEANADGESNHAPAASGAAGTGWLTGDERLAVCGAILILDQRGPTNIGRSLNALLARSSPPEVVLPVSTIGRGAAGTEAAGTELPTE